MAETPGSSNPLTELDRLPRSSEDHAWADYIELLCLVNLDREFSKADLVDRIQERKDLGESQDDPDDDASVRPATIGDRRRQRIDDYFRHLRFRESAFAEFYPFSLTRNRIVLRMYEPLSAKQRFYVFLLLSANLRYVKIHTDAITNCFEVVSGEALKQLLPEGAEVHIFGPRHGGSRYTGGLWDKINLLAGDLKEIVVALEDEFSSQDTGDGGLDLVGWVPMGDEAPSRLLVFGQCACTPEWESKQYSSSALNWRSYINFTAPPTNIAFIPFCFRRTDGRWHKKRLISETTLIDRQRLLYLLRNADVIIESHPCHELVQRALEQREPVF